MGPISDKLRLDISQDISPRNGFIGEGSSHVILVCSHQLGVVIIHRWEAFHQIPGGSGSSALEYYWTRALFYRYRSGTFSNLIGAYQATEAPHPHSVSDVGAFIFDLLGSLAVEIFCGVVIRAVARPDFIIDALNLSFNRLGYLWPDILLLFLCPGIGIRPNMVGTSGIDFIKSALYLSKTSLVVWVW